MSSVKGNKTFIETKLMKKSNRGLFLDVCSTCRSAYHFEG